jgi:hypothetical protein
LIQINMPALNFGLRGTLFQPRDVAQRRKKFTTIVPIPSSAAAGTAEIHDRN